MNASTYNQMRTQASNGVLLVDLVARFNMTPMAIINACFNALGDHYTVKDNVLKNRLKNGKSILGEDCIEKLCPLCEDYYPLTSEFWQKKSSTSDGANCFCKACCSELNRDSREKRKKT